MRFDNVIINLESVAHIFYYDQFFFASFCLFNIDFVSASFYTRLSELRKYKVDDQKIKQYFPIDIVTQGLLDIYQKTLCLKFEEEKHRPAHAAWHEEVRLFKVFDMQTGSPKLMGYFYLDLYPREGKYGHAAVWGIRPGCRYDAKTGERQLPVAAMVANFTKPTPDQPSLLQHSEVVTFFHEVSNTQWRDIGLNDTTHSSSHICTIHDS